MKNNFYDNLVTQALFTHFIHVYFMQYFKEKKTNEIYLKYLYFHEAKEIEYILNCFFLT